MSFIVTGRVGLTATAEDGSMISIGTLEEGAFLGQTALTRQPVLAGAYAIDEVTVLHIEREHMERLILRKPLLLQEIGRAIEDRRANGELKAGWIMRCQIPKPHDPARYRGSRDRS